jgi:D-aminoacyl-tRNA deacylase
MLSLAWPFLALSQPLTEEHATPGSAEEFWTRTDAAHLWARVLCEQLGLADAHAREQQEQHADSVVLVCLGGGHYAPKHGDLVRALGGRGVLLGHVVASYALDMAGDSSEWQACVREAVQATRQAFSAPAPEIVVHVDKKAFKGAERQALAAFVREDLGLRVALKASEVYTSPAK